MDWTALDEAYNMAKRNNMKFQFHVLIWGAQQPTWIRTLAPVDQLAAIKNWFAAVAQRYADIDLLEVANETLPNHNQPDNRKSDSGNYIKTLGGAGSTGWDWVLEAFRLARQYFPNTKLIINDYGITTRSSATNQYLKIIHLLQKENPIDGIDLQEHAFETASAPLSVHSANLEALAATGLPIYITELDIHGPTDAQQLAH